MKLTRKEFLFPGLPNRLLGILYAFWFFSFPLPQLPGQVRCCRLRRLLIVSILGFAGLRSSEVVAMALLHSGIRVCCIPPAIGRRRPQFDDTALPCCSRNSPICSFSGLKLSFYFPSLSAASAIGTELMSKFWLP